MAGITAVRVHWRKVPKSYRELCVCWKRTVVHRQCEPLTPYATILKVFVRRLRVDGERFRIGERLDGNVQLRIRAEVAATVSKVGASQ